MGGLDLTGLGKKANKTGQTRPSFPKHLHTCRENVKVSLFYIEN